MSLFRDSSSPVDRQAGMLKFVLGSVGVVAVVVLAWITNLDAFLKSFSTLEQLPLIGALCLPFIVLGIGLIELITGKSFRQIEASWSRLNQWQHIAAFLIVVLVAGALVIVIFVIVR